MQLFSFEPDGTRNTVFAQGVDLSIWPNGRIWVLLDDFADSEGLSPVFEANIVPLAREAAESLPNEGRRALAAVLRVAADQVDPAPSAETSSREGLA